MRKRLYKSSQNKKICGVCAGLADYFDIDVVLIRIIWAVAVFVFGSGILVYIIAAIIMPYDTDIDDGDNTEYEYAPKD
ncbi:PspC domain-containing protein [Treponema pedis]|uniref:PspC domain-containing protein n=1 Tax=Treponema pedis TaxID=409322 RepID=UPI0004236FC2